MNVFKPLLVLCTGFLTSASAQQLTPTVISPGGGVDQTSSVQLEWTLGELAIESLTGQTKSYTEGFHQPILIVEPKGIDPEHQYKLDENESESLIILTPNPVTSRLTIHFNIADPKEIHFHVSAANGGPLMQSIVNPYDGDIELDFSTFAAGMYFIQFKTDDGSIMSSFKVSKIQ